MNCLKPLTSSGTTLTLLPVEICQQERSFYHFIYSICAILANFLTSDF